MTEPPYPDSNFASSHSADRLDRARGAFEAAWKAAKSGDELPSLEKYLTSVPTDERPVLLRVLVALEIYYRRRAGEIPGVEDYRGRFPDLPANWLAAQLATVAGSGEATSVESRSPLSRERRFVRLLELLADDSAETRNLPSSECHGPVAPLVNTSDEWAASSDRPRLSDYEILDELGRGGMGIVYRAYDRKRKAIVALKMMRRGSDKALDRFKKEFRALTDVNHTNLLSLHELVSDGREWFFTMELVEGTNFLDYLAQRGAAPLSGSTGYVSPDLPPSHSELEPVVFLSSIQLDKLRNMLRQLAEGLSALHRGGILHRDVKPSNVLVTAQGRVVLLDFGLAAELDAAGLHESTQHNLVGTIAYMAPEQAACQPVSAASDCYSVGVMLYQALTGRLPFTGSASSVIQAKRERDPCPPRELVPSTPDDLNSLCMALLSRDPSARPRGEEVLDRLALNAAQIRPQPPKESQAGPAAILVGREAHLEALADAFAATRAGRAVSVHLHGRSGIGKSALVHHFLNDLIERREAVVLVGRCYERESVPYKALDSLIDALARYLGHLPATEVQALLPREVVSLGRVFPVLRRVMAVVEAPRRQMETPDQQELRRRAFAALRQLLQRLGDRVPLVLSIDDLQWGDVDSAALLADILRPPDPPVCLFLACYRSEDVEASPFLRSFLESQTRAESPVEHCELCVEALAPEETRGLALALLGRADAETRARVEAIVYESSGSPFFVRELVRHLREGNRSTQDVSLSEVLLTRIGRLPEPTQRLLEVVAVAGKPLLETIACGAAGLAADEQGAVDLLRSQQLIRRTGLSGGQEVETYHDRIRESVLANLPSAVLVGHHRRLAEVLEATGAADSELLALHFRGAGANDQAAHYYALAAERAADALAFDRAAELYRLALELWPTEGGPKKKLRIKLGDVLANAGRGADSAEQYLVAVAGANAQEAIDLNRRAAMQYMVSGHIDEGLTALQAVLGSVGMSLPRTPRRAVWSLLFRRTQLRLRGLGFRERDAAAVPAADLTRLDISWSAAIGLIGFEPIHAASFQARNLLLALQAGEIYRITCALTMEAVHIAAAGVSASRRTEFLLQQAERLTQRVDRPHAWGMIALARGMSLYLQGRWSSARSQCEQAETIFRDQCTGVAWELDTALCFSLWSLSFQGNMAELRRRGAMKAKDARARGDLYALMTLESGILRLPQLADDDPEGTQRDLDAIMDCWPHRDFHLQHLSAVFTQIYIDLYRGDGSAAWNHAHESDAAIQGSLLLRVQLLRIMMASLRGAAALAAAEVARDPKLLLRSARGDAHRLEREKAPWATALARLIRAGVASLERDKSQTLSLLDEAATAFDAVDMLLWATAARRHAGALLGGEEGRALVARADALMTEQGVVNPARMAAMYAPGFARFTANE